MNFETHQIQFEKRSTFNRALEILKKDQDEIFATYQTEDSFYDIGYSDMIITFTSRLIMNSALSHFALAKVKGIEI